MANGIYIHFPYCLYKCHYCDFNSHAYERSAIPGERYATALLTEVRRRRGIFEKTGAGFFADGTEVETVFIGGGTPSLMDPAALAAVLAELARTLLFSPDVEITLEANPGTVDRTRFEAFRAAGVNRVSLGVQSFHDKYLAAFGRIHSGDEAAAAVTAARDVFGRASCDLIFGFPGQTLSEWESDLRRALSFGLKHVSCYALTAEEGTRYTKDVKTGALHETDSDVMQAMQELTYEMTAAAGLPAYEISNFAVPDEASRHNLGYWRYQRYIGLGAGAVGQFDLHDSLSPVARQSNHKIPDHYMRTVCSDEAFFTEEHVPLAMAAQEFLMMGLRTAEGVALSEFARRFGVALERRLVTSCDKHIIQGRLVFDQGRLKPSREGFLFNNVVVADLFAALE